MAKRNRRVQRYARAMRAAPTIAEEAIGKGLRALKCGWKSQVVIDGRYILDFYHPQRRICVEVDGPYHAGRQQRKHDRERTLYLRNVHDILVLRFPNEQVRREPWMVLHSIMRYYRGRSYVT